MVTHSKDNLIAPIALVRPLPRHRCHGIALVLVLAALALAALIGFALLSTSALQAQVNSNATRQVGGEYLAESAVQAGLYYLQNPLLRPAAWASTPGYYVKAANVTLPVTAGSFDLEVQPTATQDLYTIRASGRGAVDATTHEIQTSAKVERAGIEHAGLFGGSITLPLGVSVDASVQVNGNLTNSTGQTFTALSAPLPKTAYRVPDATEINYYGADRADRQYTMPDGTVGYAQLLLTAPTAAPVAAADNPGRVFFYSNPSLPDLALATAGLHITGTLVVKGGSLSVRANGLRITPQPGMPALVVEKDVNLFRTNNTLEANGPVWIGRNITWTTLMGSSSGSALRINGALLMPAGSVIYPPGAMGTIVLKYDATRADAPMLSLGPQPAKSVTVLGWNN